MKDNTQNRVADGLSACLAALAAALLTGMMWRLRGDHGFGGSFGMYCVLTVLTLLLVWLFPRKNKVNLPFVTLAALAGAVTAGGWGTVNSQITGSLTATGLFPGEEAVAQIAVSPLSGVITMLLLGFGWLPLFGMMFAFYFSDRKYHVFNAFEGAAVFYAARYLFKFAAAPAVYKLICPQAVGLFENGLAAYGVKETPQSLLLKCMGDQSKKIAAVVSGEAMKIKIKEIPGGRNFFTCCAVLGAAFGALALVLYFVIRFRDKKGAAITALLCCAMAAAITVPDALFLLREPQALADNKWSLWEYATGFVFGLLALRALLPFARQKLKNNVTLFELKGLPKLIKKAVHVLSFFCTFCLAPVLVVYSRIDVQSEKAVLPAAIAAGVVAAAVTVLFTVRNKKTLSPLGKPPAQAAQLACPSLTAVFLLLYYFVGPARALEKPLSPVTVLMLASTALCAACYTLLTVRLKSRTEARVKS